MYIEYGTGVRTDYEYGPNRHWFSNIQTATAHKKYQNISYSFDLVGNVLGYTNDCTFGGGYRTSQSYSYDSLYQLISSTGSTRYEPVAGLGLLAYNKSEFLQDAVSSTKEYINLLSKELEYIFHPIEFSNGIIIDKNTIYYIPNNNININISLSPISIKKITFLANANLERYLCKNVFFSAFLNTTVAIPLQKEIEKKDVVVSFVGVVSVSWRF